MRPIVLSAHARPLTHVQFNKDNDLLFTCAKDTQACVWYTDNGERLGTYDGHTGAIYHLDVDDQSKLLLTAGADACAKLWEVETGKEIQSFPHESSVRCVGFSESNEYFLTVGDNSMSQEAAIFIYKLHGENVSPIIRMTGHAKKIVRAAWTARDENILSAGEDGTLRLWDPVVGKEISCVTGHRDSGINNISLYHDKSMVITSGKDHCAKLFDVRSLEHLKTYRTEYPVNSAVISPIKPHIITGGGQEAMAVTMTDSRAGKFDAHFNHLVLEDWLGCCGGHFGPINTLAISGDGKMFASGAEDGYARIHHFDKNYLSWKDSE